MTLIFKYISWWNLVHIFSLVLSHFGFIYIRWLATQCVLLWLTFIFDAFQGLFYLVIYRSLKNIIVDIQLALNRWYNFTIMDNIIFLLFLLELFGLICWFLRFIYWLLLSIGLNLLLRWISDSLLNLILIDDISVSLSIFLINFWFNHIDYRHILSLCHVIVCLLILFGLLLLSYIIFDLIGLTSYIFITQTERAWAQLWIRLISLNVILLWFIVCFLD